MTDNGDNNEDENTGSVSQIPLLNDIVYDQTRPPKAPTKTGRIPANKRRRDITHGPDYDPDTLDLFESLVSPLPALTENQTQDELRAGADRMIDSLVEEYSGKIIHRLRQELNEQLVSILDDLDPSDAVEDLNDEAAQRPIND